MNTEKEKTHGWEALALYALGSLAGALLGWLAIKGIAGAMAAKSPAFWFVSRAAGMVAYLLLWASTTWGILISSKAVKAHVSGPVAYTLHNVTAWLAMGFSAVHALALLGDRVVSFNLLGILVPFAAGYQPLWTGLGTLSLYAGLLVSFSFYFTKRIGHRTWHLIHLLAYVMFVGVTIHGAVLGTDSRTAVMQAIYFVAAGSVLFLTLFRILVAAAGRDAPKHTRAGERRRAGSSG
jgi:sulfoxide reductase heme-binding subunit YedZ